MTHITHCNNLIRLQKKYIDFLPFCTSDKQTFKILDEIQHLKLKISKINRMTMLESTEKVDFRIDVYQSISNT